MDNLWNYIDDRKLVLDISGASHHVLCGICDGLLRNASYTKCCCRFCAKCIGDYLSSGGGHLCPGCLKEGTNTDLSEDCEVVVDPASNKDVAKLRLKCPHAGCSDSVEMRTMMAHLSVCEYGGALSCLFSVVGCTRAAMTEDEVDQHLREDQRSHDEMVMEFVRSAEAISGNFSVDLVGVARISRQLNEAEQRSEATFLRDGCDTHEWRITDINEYLDKGQQYGEVFNLGGYRIGFVVDIFCRSCTHAHANLVLYPSGDAALEWPLRRDLWVQLLHPATRAVLDENKFGLRHSTRWKEDYKKPRSKSILYDSGIIINPEFSIFNWDCKSLSLRCGMGPPDPR